MKKIKVLNLYAGLGGNRKLWKDVEVTAIENNESIAKAYKQFFPNDRVIIDDSISYLIENYKMFDFIWASPPCQSHSRIRFASAKRGSYIVKIPDLRLYELILFLKHYYDGFWVVENVIPFYKPIIKPTTKIGRHYFWSNKDLSSINIKDRNSNQIIGNDTLYGFNIKNLNINIRKDQVIRNLHNPIIGKHIFDEIFGELK